MTVRSLSRRQRGQRGDAFPPSRIGDVDSPRHRAGEYLASRMLVPGAQSDDVFSRHVSDELDRMTPRERTFLEIELAEKCEQNHTYDYDSSAWRR